MTSAKLAIWPRLLILALLISLILGAPIHSQQRTQTAPAKAPPQKLASHVILISIDGLSADYVVNPDAHRLRIPNLRAWRAKGAYAVGAESVYPSITYPAHTTIVTGMLPADHGITTNRVFDEASGQQMPEWRWFAREIKTDTIWEAAKRAGLITAAIGYPVTVGAAINFNLPEIFKVREGAEETPVRPYVNPPELLDELSAALKVDASAAVNFSPDMAGFEYSDRVKADAAAYLIEKHRPHLLLLHFTSFDHAQHEYGPATAEALAVLERVDELLKRITDAVGRAGLAAETTFLVVSDHGFAKVEREFRPNVVLAKKGLLTVNAQGQITAWRAAAQTFGGSAAIIVKDARDEKTAQEAEQAFREIYEQPDSPLWRIVSRREIARLGADPRAAFYLDPAPLFMMSSRASGPVTAKAANRGAHGQLPQRSEMRAALMAAGSGIKPGVKLEYARLIDVAPTIVRLLGLEIRSARGRVISEVLNHEKNQGQ
jgi:predicted AlkP superfamily pyrophosphatase or phosphodiesterase